MQVLACRAYYMQRAIEVLDNSGVILTEADAGEISECLHKQMLQLAGVARLDGAALVVPASAEAPLRLAFCRAGSGMEIKNFTVSLFR